MITSNEAELLLTDGKTVHYSIIDHQTGMQFVGDFDRADALEALRKADKITLKTNEYLPVNHSLVTWEGNRRLYLATSESRVAAFFKVHSSPA
jgi:hypothetical protein